MKVLIANWATSGDQMRRDGLVPETEREMTPEEICALTEHYSVMLLPGRCADPSLVLLFLDERGRRFTQR